VSCDADIIELQIRLRSRPLLFIARRWRAENSGKATKKYNKKAKKKTRNQKKAQHPWRGNFVGFSHFLFCSFLFGSRAFVFRGRLRQILNLFTRNSHVGCSHIALHKTHSTYRAHSNTAVEVQNCRLRKGGGRGHSQ